ncbi:hypothetical protein IAE35_10445 [Pseudomonas sp. S75]|uniref:hypothetical protein n=1 Tax=unclassified Pseudomonas TaxID=196821 RepID=UPI0019043C96|nr:MULTISPECIES: hypothetical protein [unclassified Pseudomonas]MBJ9976761.1 hypothetical protein [Pseudomonas sp. S30]MBK0153763.1 hypothetical protein [Pseudomonas sp. S75]
MTIHYSTNGLDAACGRSSPTLASSSVTAEVSCKSCQRSVGKADTAVAVRKTPSLAELRKSAKAAVEPQPGVALKPAPAASAVARPTVAAAPSPAAPAPRAGAFSVKSAWAARLAEQHGQSRLPRGKGRQRKV